MKTIIVTHYAPTCTPHRHLFGLAKFVNFKWAQSLGWDFIADDSRRVESIYRERSAILAEVIAGLEDGDRVLWLDGDALIVASPEPIWTDLGDNDIGMVRFDSNNNVVRYWHAGVVPMTVNSATRNLWVEIRNHKHSNENPPEHEVWDANACLGCPIEPGNRGPLCGSHKIRRVELGHRWNEHHEKRDIDTRIVGHHMMEPWAKFKAMQETIQWQHS
jgi:hypothetical protein